MATYRERREARADRLRGWADKREQRAQTQLNSHPEVRHDWAFITQPGRIPFRERMNRADDRALESLRKADSMNQRAAGIEAQMANAIYSDDDDAVEALRSRVARLEAERDRIKRYNVTARKGSPDLSILDDRQREQLDSCLRAGSVFVGKGGSFPAYHLSNLSGNIKRNRDRLADLERRNAQ